MNFNRSAVKMNMIALDINGIVYLYSAYIWDYRDCVSDGLCCSVQSISQMMLIPNILFLPPLIYVHIINSQLMVCGVVQFDQLNPIHVWSTHQKVFELTDELLLAY